MGISDNPQAKVFMRNRIKSFKCSFISSYLGLQVPPITLTDTERCINEIYEAPTTQSHQLNKFISLSLSDLINTKVYTHGLVDT